VPRTQGKPVPSVINENSACLILDKKNLAVIIAGHNALNLHQRVGLSLLRSEPEYLNGVGECWDGADSWRHLLGLREVRGKQGGIFRYV